ncbi:HFX_2341 family transcriptional regulator domain-containing protein [Haloferax gibbonsii]|uniref:HFX_2341 family transcriptional regulator domain-containing protein n=1 Tax=Haloferax gibbonsii TaxID=35746 RepID=UPI000A41B86F|nr:DUF6293 family protein [Haloferax gibbonsii]
MVSVTRRIHIAPQGYEDERIYLPALELDADRVILLVHDDEDDTANGCREAVIDALEEVGVETDVRRCDLFDINNSLEMLFKEIRSRPSDDDIKVNVSAGSKITAIAGMIACMFTGADPIYIVPEGYGNDTVSYGMKEILGLPAYPIAEPDHQLVKVLNFIYTEQPDVGPEGVLLKEIGEFLLENELPAVESSGKGPGDAEDIYPIIRQKIVTPLSQRGLIEEIRYDGGNHIRISKEGKEMLEIGTSLINHISDKK